MADRKALRFLIDTGRRTKLLFKTFFGRLPHRLQQTMVIRDSSHEVTSEGTPLQSYEEITLEGRAGHLTWKEIFIVGKIKNNAILGKPFQVR